MNLRTVNVLTEPRHTVKDGNVHNLMGESEISFVYSDQTPMWREGLPSYSLDIARVKRGLIAEGKYFPCSPAI